MTRASIAFAVVVSSLLACSSSPDATPDPTKPPAGCVEGGDGCFGWITCPPEMTADPDVGGCREILPASACAAGTMAVLGSADCQAVGTTSCPQGFTKAASGWGCDAVIPDKACTGATREAIGNASCVPVGDCNAPFPPANATLFVSPTATVDATHFQTIGAALAAAQIGAVIAVDSGTYNEGIEAKSNTITVVGRCAEKVRLVGTGLEVWGVMANSVKNLVVSGVTLVDHYEGVRAQHGSITITDSVIESPRSSGFIAWPFGSSIHAERVVIRNVKEHPTKQTAPVLSVNADGGATIELLDSAVEGSWGAAIAITNATDPKHTSTLKADRIVVRDTNLADHETVGAAVVVTDTSHADVTNSLITDTKRHGVLALGDGATASVSGTVIRRSLEDATGASPSGAAAFEGGHVDLVETSLRDEAMAGFFATGKFSRISAKNVVVEHTLAESKTGDFGMGAWAEKGAEVQLDTTALVKSSYYGVGATDANTKVGLTNVLVSEVATDRHDDLGRGLNIEFGAAATLDRVTVERTGDEGIFVRGENKDGTRATAVATRILVRDLVGGGAQSSGTGIAVETGATMALDTALVLHAISAGIIVNEVVGAAGNNAEATIVNTVVRDPIGGKDVEIDANSVALSGPGIGSGGKLTLSKSSVVGAYQFGVVLANPTSFGALANVVVNGTKPGKQSGAYGHGIGGLSAPLVAIRDSVIRANQAGIVFSGGAGVVGDTLIMENAVGVHVQGEGMALVTAAKAPDTPPENTVVVADDSKFVGNGTRVGSGVLPLPTNPLLGSDTAAKP